MRYAQLLTSIMNRIIDVYDANADTKLPERASLLEKVSWLSELILICGLALYSFCAALHLINPIYGYFWQHEFRALFPLYIPFVDEKMPVGFATLISIQTIEISIAAIATGCADFPFMIAVINTGIFSTIFHDKVSELSGILRAKKQNLPLARAELQSICAMYYDIWMCVIMLGHVSFVSCWMWTLIAICLFLCNLNSNRFIDDMNTVSFLCIFITIFCAAVATAVELFVCLKVRVHLFGFI